MPQTRALVVRSINSILSHMPWDESEFPSEDSVDARIHWILNLEEVYSTVMVIPVVIWLHHRFTGVYPTDETVRRIVMSRTTSEREEDGVTEKQVANQVRRLLGGVGILERYREDALQLTSLIRNEIDETPLRAKSIISAFSNDITAGESADGQTLQEVEKIVRERIQAERQSVRLCVGIWLFKRLNGSWPRREHIAKLFPRMDMKLVDQLITVGTLRVRAVRHVALGHHIDPTRIP